MFIQRYMEIVSGRSEGMAAQIARAALRTLSWPYALVTSARNAMFEIGLKKIHLVDVPVIAVGNLTTGGTGKTPIVATLVQLLQELGLRPGIVSRGYHADATGENDEKRVLAQLCPGVPHEQNSDRVTAANTIIRNESVNVIVLDDAFQHRRIDRQLNIVLIDATNPFGFGHLLPRGLLRESMSGLRRADVALITRADAVSPESLQSIRETIASYNKPLTERTHLVSFHPTGLLSSTGSRQTPDAVNNKPVAVATAIGNPDAFVATCEGLGAQVVSRTFFPDHHHYTTSDIEQIQNAARTAGAEIILTTLKDLVKIPTGQDDFWAVQIESAIQSPASSQMIDELRSATANFRSPHVASVATG